MIVTVIIKNRKFEHLVLFKLSQGIKISFHLTLIPIAFINPYPLTPCHNLTPHQFSQLFLSRHSIQGLRIQFLTQSNQLKEVSVWPMA